MAWGEGAGQDLKEALQPGSVREKEQSFFNAVVDFFWKNDDPKTVAYKQFRDMGYSDPDARTAADFVAQKIDAESFLMGAMDTYMEELFGVWGDLISEMIQGYAMESKVEKFIKAEMSYIEFLVSSLSSGSDGFDIEYGDSY